MREEQIALAVDTIFIKYDVDRNGYLDADEVYRLILDSNELHGIHKRPTQQELDKFFSKFFQQVQTVIFNLCNVFMFTFYHKVKFILSTTFWYYP